MKLTLFGIIFFRAPDIKICWTNQLNINNTHTRNHPHFLCSKPFDNKNLPGGAWQHALSLLSASQERRLIDGIIFDATVSACANSDQWQQAMVLLVQAACWRVTRTPEKKLGTQQKQHVFGKRVGEGNKKHVSVLFWEWKPKKGEWEISRW